MIREVVMKKKLVAMILAAAVGITAVQAMRYDTVAADRVEEVTAEDAGDTEPQDDAAIEEVIDEDYDVSSVAVNAANFPDENFRSYVSSNFDTDSNGYLSTAEISNAKQIELNGYMDRDPLAAAVSDLTGIEFLTSLEYLVCGWNHVTELNLANNTMLRNVSIYGTDITNLDLSNNPRVTNVAAGESSLESINISNCPNLASINLTWCPLETLDIRNCPMLVDAVENGERVSWDGYNIAYCFFTDEGYIDLGRGNIMSRPTLKIISSSGVYGGVAMYRLYNPNSGEHFYTSSEAERINLLNAGWNDEGVGWIAPRSSNTPVYRLYNQYGGEHHYTTNLSERNHLISLGWNDEGIGWYSDDDNTVPLYRQYNPNAFANNHNYTTSRSENNWLVSLGWQAEGIGWYGYVEKPLYY